MRPRFEAAQVRRYYEQHTSAFVRFGQGGQTGAIHRAVWGPGTTTRVQAFHYVDDLIADIIEQEPPSPAPAHVVDLGCGVGASVCYLAQRRPIRATGITISPLQARLASQRAADAGLAGRVACIEGDYCDLPPGVAQASLAYAIESFVHAPSPERFFAQCGALVRRDGLLVICDDFRRPTTDPAALQAIDRFVRGWHVNTLLDRHALHALARVAGFEHESTIDLTPFLEIDRPRDRTIAALASVLRRLPVYGSRFGPMLGGSALQACLAHGWIGYDFVVFRRRR
jgi:SAM-dependent methyltransferase